MTLIPILQSAPRRDGPVGTPSVWSGAPVSTTSRTAKGRYLDSRSTTFTFTAPSTVQTIGTGTWSITWTDTLGNSGSLPVGTGYTAGIQLLVRSGVTIAFGAGTATGSETFTLAVRARNALRPDHRILRANAIPLAITPVIETSPLDEQFRTRDSRLVTVDRAILRNPTINLDYLTEVERKILLRMQHERHDLTLFEDYEEDTVFLWRAREGLMPLIGEAVTFTRTGTASYLDPVDNLWKSVAANAPRFKDGKLDRGTLVQQSTALNILTRFHPTSANLAWSGSGTSTVTFDADIKSNLDPNDSMWDPTVLAGTARAFLDGGSSGVGLNPTFTVTASSTYTAQVWIRGRGNVALNFKSGIGVANVITGTTQLTFDTDDWTRVVVRALTLASHTVGDLELKADSGDCVIWIGPAQVDSVGNEPTELIQCIGTPNQIRNVEVARLLFKMPSSGTLALWWYIPNDGGITTSGVFNIFEATSHARFSLRFNVATNVIQFYTDSSGQLASGAVALVRGTWQHLAVTWKRSTTAGSIDRAIYHNGVLLGSDISSSWSPDWGASFDLAKTGQITQYTAAFQEVRCDARAQSAEEIARWYNRFIESQWIQPHLMYGGRTHRIAGTSEQWLDLANLGRYIVQAKLTESGTIPESLVTRQ